MAKGKVALAAAALALLAILPLSALADELTSGPPVGSHNSAFNVQDVTGLAKGGKICYI